jgi:hypothetical protein
VSLRERITAAATVKLDTHRVECSVCEAHRVVEVGREGACSVCEWHGFDEIDEAV